MAAQGIKAGAAYVLLTANSDLLKSGLKKAQAMLSTFAKTGALVGAGLVAGGTAVLGPLAGLAMMASDMGSALKDASDRTGIQVEALSALDYAARMSDTSLDGLVGGIFKLQKSLSGAGKSDPFKSLGLSADELKAMKPEDAFTAVADALANMENPADRNAKAMQIFGRGAADLIPLLAAGEDGISEMRAEFERLNMTVSTVDAGAAEEFGDKVEQVGMQIKRAMFGVGISVINAVSPYIPLVTDAIGAATGWIDQNRQMVVAGAAAAAGVVVLGGAILATSGIALAGSVIAGGLLATLGAVSTVVAALVSPLGLVAAAAGVMGFSLAVGAFEFFNFSDAGRKMAADIRTKVGGLVGFFKTTVGGISDALAAGDIKLAGQIAMVGLQIAFLEGKNVILNIWSGLTRSIAKMWAGAMMNVQSAWQSMTASISEFNWAFFNPEDSKKKKELTQQADDISTQMADARNAGDWNKWEQLKGEHDKVIAQADAMGPEGEAAAAQKKITEAYERRLAEIDKGTASDEESAKERRAELDRLLAEQQRLRQKAAEERTNFGNNPDGKPKPRPKLPDLVTAAAVAPVGSFSGAFLQRQSGFVSSAEVIKEHTASIDKNLQTLVDRRNNGDGEDTYDP